MQHYNTTATTSTTSLCGQEIITHSFTCIAFLLLSPDGPPRELATVIELKANGASLVHIVRVYVYTLCSYEPIIIAFTYDGMVLYPSHNT